LLAEQQIQIGTFGTDGQWGEIDNPEDLAIYRKMISEGELELEKTLDHSK